MRPSAWMRTACLTLCLLSPGQAQQSPVPSPEATAAARELVAITWTAENFRAFTLFLLQVLKPVIVQNQRQIERDYDTIMPLLIKRMNTRRNEYIEQLAAVYARAFTAEELREAVAFGPTSQRFVRQGPLIEQESLIIWQRFSRSVGAGVIEELRKRGHDIRVMTMLSGSMHPTLPEGGLVRVLPTKQLQAGDVVAFRLPKDKSTFYVKRIVGFGGDRIQMLDGVLYINGQAVKRERVEDYVSEEKGVPGKNISIRRWRETLPNGVSYMTLDLIDNGFYDNTRPYEVPAGHYFMMGDNRDNSTDSRVPSQVGYVPAENIIGKVAPLRDDMGGQLKKQKIFQ